jgi:predicted dehydrogenase
MLSTVLAPVNPGARLAGVGRIGVFGARRGLALARQCSTVGLDVVAVCDADEERLASACRELRGVTAYREFDAMLEHDLDAVVLANHFDEHAPFAVQALDAGRHVLSETAACRSVGEAVALVRAAERSRARYMFAENYPYLAHVQTLWQLIDDGILGEVQYAEADYLHSLEPGQTGAAWAGDTTTHWRGRIASTAYCTHTVSPLLYLARSRPVQVSAFPIPADARAESRAAAARGAAPATVLVVTLESGAVLRALFCFLQGEQVSWVRVHGTHALAESLRGDDTGLVRVRREAWAGTDGAVVDRVIGGEDLDRDPLVGADRRMCEVFRSLVDDGATPALDVYAGVDATLVGIRGLRSLEQGGVPVEVPDLRNPDQRMRWQDDTRDGLCPAS